MSHRAGICQAAVNATGAGGEVDALDPLAYFSLTISQAVTIEGQGGSLTRVSINLLVTKLSN